MADNSRAKSWTEVPRMSIRSALPKQLTCDQRCLADKVLEANLCSQEVSSYLLSSPGHTFLVQFKPRDRFFRGPVFTSSPKRVHKKVQVDKARQFVERAQEVLPVRAARHNIDTTAQNHYNYAT